MKRLTHLLLLLSVLSTDAAITVFNKGTANAAATGTSLSVTPASNMAAGTFVMLFVAVDNVGTNGDTKNIASCTDSTGSNTWTVQLDTIYDPGAAGAGVEIGVCTSPLGTQITTSNTVTVSFTTSATGRVARLMQAVGATGPYYVTSGSISDLLTSGQTGTAVSMTTGSIASGDVVFCWAGSESSTGSTTGDSDTTNGSWAANLSSTATTAPMRLDVQSKITTGTGTQSYDITLGASTDWQSAWLQVSETSPTNINSTTNGFFLWQ